MGSPGRASPTTRRRLRGVLLLLIATAVLISAILATTLVPKRFRQSVDTARAELSEVARPARTLTTELKATLDRQAAAVRAYLLDRDVGNAARYREARISEDSILLQLAPLARDLGPQAVAQLADVRTRALEWHEEQDRLLLDEAGYAPEFLRRLPAQQARYDQVLAAAERLAETVVELEASREESVARLVALEEPLLRSTSWIGGIAVLVALLLAWRSILLSGRPARRALEESERQLRDLADLIQEVFWILDVKAGRFLYVSPSYERIWGRSPQPLYAGYGNFLATVHPEDRARVEAAERPTEIEYRVVRPDGTIRWIAERSLPMADAVDDSGRWIGVAADVTERVESRQHLAHLALHDPLTGLGNHLLLLDRLEHALARGRRVGTGVTVMVVDLDDFQAVRQRLGTGAADRLLAAVAQRLDGTLRSEDTLVRLGDDRFAAIIEGAEGETEVGRAAARVAAVFETPFTSDGESVELAANVVTTSSPAGTLTTADVGRLADEALHRTRTGRRPPDRRGRLRRAVEKDEFRVHYQPVVDLATSELVGLEALLRWEHPTRGLLPPSEFLRLAEESGLIHPIGLWVLRRVCEDLQAWESAPGPLQDIWVAINVSRVQFELPDFGTELVRILDASGVLPGRLRVEVDESAWFRARQPLQRLHDLGVRVSVDRFGERYGALGALRRLPVDSLKLSRGLGFGPFGKRDSSSSVGSIVGLASGLGLSVTAVGVETMSELRSLRQIGCNTGQGYYFAPALDEDALRGWLARGGPGRAAGSLL